MTLKGKVKNGVIELEGGVLLPEGAAVEVVLKQGEANPVSDDDLDPIFRIAELAVDTGIPDLATNIDHYLYGHPKVTDGN